MNLFICLAMTIFATLQIEATYQKKVVFPDDYLGFWEGDVTHFTIGPDQVSRMTLHLYQVKNTNMATWEFTTLDASGLTRQSYWLSAVSEKKRRFHVDMGKKKIVVASFLGDGLYWNQISDGTRLDCRFQFNRKSDTVYVELVTTIESGDDKTEIHSSPPSGVLRGTLKGSLPPLPQLPRK